MSLAIGLLKLNSEPKLVAINSPSIALQWLKGVFYFLKTVSGAGERGETSSPVSVTGNVFVVPPKLVVGHLRVHPACSCPVILVNSTLPIPTVKAFDLLVPKAPSLHPPPSA